MIRDGKRVRRTGLAITIGLFWGFFALFWLFVSATLIAAMLKAGADAALAPALALALAGIPIGSGLAVFAVAVRPNVTFQADQLHVRNVFSVARIPYDAITTITAHDGLAIHTRDGSALRPFAFRNHLIFRLFHQGKPAMVATELSRRAKSTKSEGRGDALVSVARSGIALLVFGALAFLASLLMTPYLFSVAMPPMH